MTNDSVSEWLDRVRSGDEHAAEQLWARYFDRLSRLARQRLPKGVLRDFDEEDVALSAFHSLLRGAQAGRYPRLEDRDNLWALLCVITSRKANHAIRDRLRLKRGGGQVMGESVLGSHGASPEEMAAFLSQEPSADFAALLADEIEQRVASLRDDDMRKIAQLKLNGSSNEEIAVRLDCAVRTVERRIRLIRKLWEADETEGSEVASPRS